MGYVSLIADCGQCGRPFASNPDYVPSLRLANGRRLIFCRARVEAAKAPMAGSRQGTHGDLRVAMGRETPRDPKVARGPPSPQPPSASGAAGR